MPIAKPTPDTQYLLSLFNYKDGNLYWSVNRLPAIKIGNKAGKLRSGYIYIMVDGKSYPAHRLIYKMMHGNFNEAMLIDHIDGNTSNNKIQNLRLADKYQNMHNQPWRNRNKNTNTKGVDFLEEKQVYRGRVQYMGKRYTKNFHDIEIAKSWVLEIRLKLHKDFTNNG